MYSAMGMIFDGASAVNRCSDSFRFIGELWQCDMFEHESEIPHLAFLPMDPDVSYSAWINWT